MIAINFYFKLFFISTIKSDNNSQNIWEKNLESAISEQWPFQLKLLHSKENNFYEFFKKSQNVYFPVLKWH